MRGDPGLISSLRRRFWGQKHAAGGLGRAVVIMRPHASGKLIPRVVGAEQFLKGNG
ncbi:hypothetical protein L6Q96_19075 [Candidatus Binatia bacterium]|nr:hypothetical protein [Candidatus Binatia bacterium]